MWNIIGDGFIIFASVKIWTMSLGWYFASGLEVRTLENLTWKGLGQKVWTKEYYKCHKYSNHVNEYKMLQRSKIPPSTPFIRQLQNFPVLFSGQFQSITLKKWTLGERKKTLYLRNYFTFKWNFLKVLVCQRKQSRQNKFLSVRLRQP